MASNCGAGFGTRPRQAWRPRYRLSLPRSTDTSTGTSSRTSNATSNGTSTRTSYVFSNGPTSRMSTSTCTCTSTSNSTLLEYVRITVVLQS